MPRSEFDWLVSYMPLARDAGSKFYSFRAVTGLSVEVLQLGGLRFVVLRLQAAQQTQMASRPLYGGACRAQIPQGWADMSDSRPVPDTQEVYMAQDGSGASLVFEIVERADVADDGAARYHFDDVADAAAAVSRAVVATGSVPAPTAPVCVVALGNMTMTKAESTDGAHSVDVGIAAFRFPDEATDVLCTLNVPALDGSQLREGPLDLAVAPGMRPLADVVASLVVDRGLFGGE